MAAEILTLEDDKAELESTIKNLKAQVKKVKEEAVDEKIYEKLFDDKFFLFFTQEESMKKTFQQLNLSNAFLFAAALEDSETIPERYS